MSPCGENVGGPGDLGDVSRQPTAARLCSLPVKEIHGQDVPMAVGGRARLLGLAGLRRDEAGAGLFIPRCASVHTFGMRFALDVFFLDVRGAVLAIRRDLSPRRFASCRRAAAVLEIPSGEGGEFMRLAD